MATTRQVLQILESYQKARITFSQTVAELSNNAQNVEILHTAGVLELLRPLLIDSIPTIQQTSALGLGRLANWSEDMAEEVVSHHLLVQLVFSLKNQNRYSKKASASVLRSVAKHNAELAQAVVESGALEDLVSCLEEFDPSVKEVGATAVGNVAKHNVKLARAVVDAGAVPLLVLCVQEPELILKRAALAALADIAKHAPELAQLVVDAGTVPFIAPLVVHIDAKIKRQVCLCLGQIARHTVDLAEVLLAAELFPKLFLCLKDIDHQVRRQAAIVVREVAKHTPQMAQFIVSTGGVAALVDNCAECLGNDRLPAIMALGYIAAFDESLSTTIIQSNGVKPLVDALTNEQEDHIQSASAWSLGQVGRHSPVHSLAVAEAGVLPQLVTRLLAETSSEDLRSKCKRALKAIIEHLTHIPALDSLLQGPPLPIETLKYVIAQLAKVLPNDPEGRTKFVTSGGLEKLLQMNFGPDPEMKSLVDGVNASYPKEVVQYYDPGYEEILLQKLTGAKPGK
ncbi:hypothetical protein SELMODRAFT_99379 [Selaginella moellendorffii]|uniref:Uncharacterized protein n=1 Tax=Selaginella moellendorffii TaxID=88036 RepID=D8RPX6_SELML|nr:sperm-associated antigen 6 [Selaginella moellendorffii]EFJ25759.1 hypothetical protein SELMODRAFT_99379 [Selaginella moellendorffii]|eukprot:XP_002973385.1 sperm-associated antigen 6 [Selaginella moellendorffii]